MFHFWIDIAIPICDFEDKSLLVIAFYYQTIRGENAPSNNRLQEISFLLILCCLMLDNLQEILNNFLEF